VRLCLGMLTAAAGVARLEAQTPASAMSAEQLAAFWEAVEADPSLQEKLSASTDGEIDTPIEAAAVVAIAKDAGFTITPGDLLRADAQAILELNDDELEKVAGGEFSSIRDFIWGRNASDGENSTYY
jgi:predicted ribosomally synthesized peptide with nif11-like leader